MDMPSDTVGQNFSSNSFSSDDRILLAILTLLRSARDDWIIINRKPNTIQIAAKLNNCFFCGFFFCLLWGCVLVCLGFFLLYILNIALPFQNNWSVISLNLWGGLLLFVWGFCVLVKLSGYALYTDSVSAPWKCSQEVPQKAMSTRLFYNNLTAMICWIGLEDHCPQSPG